jgi:hypothetical protein
MPRLPLGPWRPDAPIYDNPGLVNMRNAIPAAGKWLAQPGLSLVAEQTITAPVNGLFSAVRSNGDVELFVGFDGVLFRLPSADGFPEDVADPGRSDDYATGEFVRWRTVQYGDLLIATNYEDEVQAYDLIGGGTFLPLADVSGECPRAKYIAVVKGFVTLAYTFDDVDGEDGFQVRWHGFFNGLPNPYDFTRDASTQADSQRLSEIGVIAGITGGEFGTIIGESGVVRQSFGDLLFRFDTVERRIGCRLPNSIVQYRQFTFFRSPQGFASFDGNTVRLIGVEKIDRWFAEDFDEAFAHKMWAAVEIGRGHALWLYCGKGHSGEPNRLLRYSVELDEWAVSDFNLMALSSGRTFGRTLDDDFFDNLDDPKHANLDDPSLWQSVPQMVGVGILNVPNTAQVVGFGGPPLTATFETGEITFGGDNNRAMLRRGMVRGQGGVSSLSIFSRDLFSETGGWSDEFPEQADGWIRFRVPGRSQRARIVRSGSWVDVVDVNLLGESLGER